MSEEVQEQKYSDIDKTSMSLTEVTERRHKAGKEWVDACAIHHWYDKGSDGKIKRIMSKIRAEQDPPSGKKNWLRDDLRDHGQATPEWKKYLREWNDAYRTMLDALNEKTAWDQFFEARRTDLINERELRKSS